MENKKTYYFFVTFQGLARFTYEGEMLKDSPDDSVARSMIPPCAGFQGTRLMVFIGYRKHLFGPLGLVSTAIYGSIGARCVSRGVTSGRIGF